MALNQWGGLNSWANSGVGISKSERITYQRVANELRLEGYSGGTNEILVKWLKSEGATGGTFNELFYDYWETLGFSGAYNDKWRAWLDS